MKVFIVTSAHGIIHDAHDSREAAEKVVPFGGGIIEREVRTAKPGTDAARYVDTAEFKAGVRNALAGDPKFDDAVKAFVMDGLIMGLQTSEFREAVLNTVLNGMFIASNDVGQPYLTTVEG